MRPWYYTVFGEELFRDCSVLVQGARARYCLYRPLLTSSRHGAPPELCWRRAEPHNGHSVNQRRENPANRSYRLPEDQALAQQSLPKVKMPIGDNYASLPEWKPRTKRLPGYPH